MGDYRKVGVDMILVTDLDGTLCDHRHRIEYANAEYARATNWEQYHSLCYLDPPHDDVLELLQNSKSVARIVAVTSRNERWRNVTMQWLQKYDVPVDDLLMRPDNDYRAQEVVKLDLLREHLTEGLGFCEARHKEMVWTVLDDNQKCVDAWRGAGFGCWQVREPT